ncbi:MAG: carbohydrate kinase [Sphingobacterium composti]
MKHTVIGFGEVLWDLLPEGARIGGAPLNVCYHLNKTGLNSFIISQVGKDELGDKILSEIKNLGVNADYLIQIPHYPTSTVEVSLDAKGSPKYTIVENVAWDYISFNQDVACQIAKADAFVFGSLVARNQHSYQTLLKYVSSSTYTVMDVNLRFPFYTKEIIFNLLHHVDLLKINDEEINIIGKWAGIESEDELAICKYLIATFPKMKEILLTKGSQGALYYSSDIIVRIGIYEVQVDDTIGAGDSFLAAFLAKKLQGEQIQTCMEEAALVSAFVASKSGANPIYSKDDLINFKKTHILKKPLQ